MIEFTRELKTPEDVRQNGEHYTSVQWTTKLNKIICNIQALIQILFFFAHSKSNF